jgi:hypothetical protein
VSLLTRAADKLIEAVVPHASARAEFLVPCACSGGYHWSKYCEDLNGELHCSACNVKGAKC